PVGDLVQPPFVARPPRRPGSGLLRSSHGREATEPGPCRVQISSASGHSPRESSRASRCPSWSSSSSAEYTDTANESNPSTSDPSPSNGPAAPIIHPRAEDQ